MQGVVPMRPVLVKVVSQDGYQRTLPGKFIRFNADAPAKDASFLTVCRWPAKRNEADAPVEITPCSPSR
jgi:hypothetical protein